MTDKDIVDAFGETVGAHAAEREPNVSPIRKASLDPTVAGTMPGTRDLPPRGTQPERSDPLALQATVASAVHEPLADETPDDALDPHLRKQVLAGLFQHHRSEVDKIDRFPILRKLGAGGMGVVYSGYDEELDRRIAIKLVRSRAGDGSKDTDAKRLLREARAMAKLDHPNVVHVYQAGPSEGGTFIAMEFVRGRTLADWLEEQRRPWREVIEVFVQAGRGLAAAHAAGIVHRDFKPANAMIDEHGVVKVLDFGLARAPGGSAAEQDEAGERGGPAGERASMEERLTRTGAMMGTPAYMAPEQIEGLGTDDKSDQFSFCVALYEGLYGQLPFPTDSMMELLAANLTGQVRPPPRGHGVPQWVHQIVIRGLALDPAQRHPSMALLLEALEHDKITRRRRRLGLGVAFVSIGLLGFTLAPLLSPPDPPATCDDASIAMAEVWNPSRREALEAALAATGVSYAREAWDRVEPQLDDYVEDWAGMRQEACQAHLAVQQSDALFDQRNACLDRRLAGLRTLLDQLEDADASVVDKLPVAVTELPPIAFCGDTEALTADVRPPEDPAVAAEVEELRAQIARAHAHESLGRYEAGLELIEPVVVRAKELGYAPLEAEALLQHGYLQQHGGTTEQTMASLAEAELRAIAGNHPEIIAAAMSRKMLLRGTRLGELARALEDVPQIEAHLERVPHAQGLRGVLLNDEAELHRRQGELERAVEGFEASLAVKRVAFGERHVEIAFTLENLATTFFEQGDHQRASATLEESISIYVETLGARHPMTVKAMGIRAEVLLAQGCVAQARPIVDQTLALLEESGAMSSPLALRPLVVAAQLERESRNYARARERLELARSVAESLHVETSKILLLQNLGEVELASGAVERGLELYEHARELACDGLGEEDPFCFYLLRELANAQQRAGRLEPALEHAERALAGFQGLGDEVEVGWTLVTLGLAQAKAGRSAEANESLARALAARPACSLAVGDLECARIEVEQGRVLLDLGRAADARATLERAEAILAQRCEGDTLELALARADLARALLELDTPEPERARQLGAQAASALTRLGPAFAEEAELVDAWHRSQGWHP